MTFPLPTAWDSAMMQATIAIRNGKIEHKQSVEIARDTISAFFTALEDSGMAKSVTMQEQQKYSVAAGSGWQVSTDTPLLVVNLEKLHD